ncbi:hypothetical protein YASMINEVIRUS_920 [Yasminevirus sp. GU-2018]|uniref:Uncharacterized protein n=1 Tax=Yasminevirus sp. GU-2018 TaxID=2420051 RepID=A0A5K0U945_9VIRU|nr:hypothetical protein YASMINEVIRUS_920 [Yasminevirus sp. GU-2018]
MSNTLNSFETALLTDSIPKYTGKKTPGNSIGVPEVYGYNVITDQDKDILNQGTADHIKRYFDKKQAEHEASTQTVLSAVEIHIKKLDSKYSINNRGFIIKFLVFIIFVVIVWDFATHEKIV